MICWQQDQLDFKSTQSFVLKLLFSGLIMMAVPTLVLASSSKDPLFSKAIHFFQQGEYQNSKLLLLDLTKKSPNNSLYLFNLGNAYYQLNDYDQAIKAYREVIKNKSPLKPAARVYMAKAYKQKDLYLMSLKALKELSRQELPPNLHNEYIALLEELKIKVANDIKKTYEKKDYQKAYKSLNIYLKFFNQGQEAYILKGLLETKMGKANKAQETWSKIAETYFGEENILVKDMLSIQKKDYGPQITVQGSLGYDSNAQNLSNDLDPVSSTKEEFYLKGGYLLNHRSNTSFLPAYQFQWQNLNDLELAQTQTHKLSLETTIKMSWGEWFIMPFVQSSTIEGEKYLNESGFLLNYRYFFERHELGLRYVLSLKSGKNEFEYLSGQDHSAKLFYGYNFDKSYLEFYLRFLNIGSDHLEITTGTVPLAYKGVEFGASMYFLINTNWQLILNASVAPKDYDLGRKDTNIVYELMVHRKISTAWRLISSLTRINNSSNFDEASPLDKNFKQTVFEIGLRWDYQ